MLDDFVQLGHRLEAAGSCRKETFRHLADIRLVGVQQIVPQRGFLRKTKIVFAKQQLVVMRLLDVFRPKARITARACRAT